jgi:biotin carboxylase
MNGPDTRRLLIIGAGREQIPAYQRAKEIGLAVTGTDQNARAPALAYADDALIASTRDAKETLRVVCDYARTRRIDGVMTIANDVPLTVALVAQALELPGISPDAAQCAANKVLMKERFAAHQVLTPRGSTLTNKDELHAAVGRYSFPCILKPGDGRGSRGVLYLDETVNLDWAWEHSLKYAENKVLLLEEFVAGPQLSVEGLFVDGRYYPIAFADRNYANLSKTKPYIVEDGGVIPSRFEGAMLRHIGNVIEQGANALGIKWGSVKADIVLREEQPVVIELAARLSGNYLATHHIPMAYGVDIVSAMIRLALGLSVDPLCLQPSWKKYLGVRYFFPPPGRISAIRGTEAVRARQDVRMLHVYLSPGAIQSTIDSHGARAGTVICEGPTYQAAKDRVEECVAQVQFLQAN